MLDTFNLLGDTYVQHITQHIYDDIYIQFLILVLLSVAGAFIVDVVIEVIGGKEVTE